jgi:hypothetical protein
MHHAASPTVTHVTIDATHNAVIVDEPAYGRTWSVWTTDHAFVAFGRVDAGCVVTVFGTLPDPLLSAVACIVAAN